MTRVSTTSSPEQSFAAALGSRRFGPNGCAAPPQAGSAALHQKPAPLHAIAPAAHGVATAPALRAGDVHLGDAETGGAVGVSIEKLIEGRLLVQGVSGAGKSWTLRRLLEQTAGRIQQILIDPEGDFGELGDQLGLLRLDGHRLDMATLATAAARAREHRASVLLDLSDLDREDQMKAVTAFLAALIAAPREHWLPCLVAIDEAHLFAPFGGFTEATSVRRAAISALTDLMSRGRKRGLAGVLATQRLARLHKSVVSDVLNFMVGMNTLDLDIRRAAETIGWDARRAFDRLPALEPGNFVVVGPAFSRSPCVAKVGPVETPHRGATPSMTAPAIDRDTASRLLDLESLLADSAADQQVLAERAEPAGLRQIRGFIRDPAFADAGRVWGTLARVAPDGARVVDLARTLNRTAEQIAAALALLDLYAAVEFSGDGAGRAVRISKGMSP